jgi:hypothetical protein
MIFGMAGAELRQSVVRAGVTGLCTGHPLNLAFSLEGKWTTILD